MWRLVGCYARLLWRFGCALKPRKINWPHLLQRLIMLSSYLVVVSMLPGLMYASSRPLPNNETLKEVSRLHRRENCPQVPRLRRPSSLIVPDKHYPIQFKEELEWACVYTVQDGVEGEPALAYTPPQREFDFTLWRLETNVFRANHDIIWTYTSKTKMDWVIVKDYDLKSIKQSVAWRTFMTPYTRKPLTDESKKQCTDFLADLKWKLWTHIEYLAVEKGLMLMNFDLSNFAVNDDLSIVRMVGWTSEEFAGRSMGTPLKDWEVISMHAMLDAALPADRLHWTNPRTKQTTDHDGYCNVNVNYLRNSMNNLRLAKPDVIQVEHRDHADS